MKSLLILIFTISCVYSASRIKYDGYKVYRITPTSEEQRELLLNLEKKGGLNFWTRAGKTGKPVDVMVKPDDQKYFVEATTNGGMLPKVFIDDVQSRINNERIGNYSKEGKMSWDRYYPYEDIVDWLTDLRQNNIFIVQTIPIATSAEGREVAGVLLTHKLDTPVIVIEGGIHGNEWISPATVTYIINELLTSSDPKIRRLANSFQWFMYPSINPDGYVYTHTTDRMWRKTVREYPDLPCKGADSNRNFNVHWTGDNFDSCTDDYSGPEPFSERENFGIVSLTRWIRGELKLFVSLQSYGQMILLPYGYTTDHLSNYEDVLQIGKKGAEALAERYGTEYEVGTTAEMLGVSIGISTDYVKIDVDTPIVLGYQVRDNGTFGYLLPADQIIPNGQEVIDSLYGLLEEAEKLGYVELDPIENYDIK